MAGVADKSTRRRIEDGWIDGVDRQDIYAGLHEPRSTPVRTAIGAGNVSFCLRCGANHLEVNRIAS
jgi:hypothetical protein